MPEIEEAEYDVMDRYRRMSRASERYGCSIRELDKWIRSGRKGEETPAAGAGRRQPLSLGLRRASSPYTGEP